MSPGQPKMGRAVAVGTRALRDEVPVRVVLEPPPGRPMEGRMLEAEREDIETEREGAESEGTDKESEGADTDVEGTDSEGTDTDTEGTESEGTDSDTEDTDIEGTDNGSEGTVKLRSVGTETKVLLLPRPAVGDKFVRTPLRLRSVGKLTVKDGAMMVGVIEISVGRPFGLVVEIKFVPRLGPLIVGMIPEGSEVGRMSVRDGRLPLGMLIEGMMPEGSDVGMTFVNDGREPLGNRFEGELTGGVIVGTAVKSLMRELRTLPPPPLGLRIEEITEGRP